MSEPDSYPLSEVPKGGLGASASVPIVTTMEKPAAMGSA